jgi:hypothetical protein
MVAIAYSILTFSIIIFPQFRIPYIVLLAGTVVLVIFYYQRLYGIPIPFTEIVITDLSSDHRDAITKICQQVMLIPVTALLIINTKNNNKQK